MGLLSQISQHQNEVLDICDAEGALAVSAVCSGFCQWHPTAMGGCEGEEGGRMNNTLNDAQHRVT